MFGFLMMFDGAWQAMGVAGMLSTIADRSWRDRGVFLAHVVLGVALVVAGRQLADSSPAAPSDRESGWGARIRTLPVVTLVTALLVAWLETPWFDVTTLAVRALYTLVGCAVLLRRTTLPTT